jgi:phosphate:Na+ symporter
LSATEILLHLMGGAALLLWAMRMVRTGVMRAYGAELRHFLSKSLTNRFAALFAGLGITVLVQSSTATAMLTSSFAGRGLLAASTALAIMLGADIGSTIVAQVLSFDLGAVSPVLVLVGVVTFMSGEGARRRAVGRAILGLGLILLSLRLIVTAAAPINHAQGIHIILSGLADEPLLAVLVAAILTWLAHSSLAVVLLVMSLATGGLVSLPLAFAMVLGANLGNPIPALVASLASGPAARRVVLGNLVFKAVGVLAALPVLGELGPLLASLEPDPGRQVADLHTAFNLFIAVVFIFLTGPVAHLVQRLVPDRLAAENPAAPRYLDDSDLEMPTAALASAAREALRMGDQVEAMLRRFFEILQSGDRNAADEFARMDDAVDSLHESIKLYLTRLSQMEMDAREGRRSSEIMAFVTNMEHIGDIIDKNLMDAVHAKIRERLRFSDEGMAEITAMHAKVLNNLHLAMGLFMTPDVRTARALLAEKARLRDIERSSTESHIVRLQNGRRESIETSSLHLDILRDLKRINSHIASVAYPVLDAAGELKPRESDAPREPLPRGEPHAPKA